MCKYDTLIIQSQYISKLVDHLNAEIVSGTVKNIEEATTWLGYTYYYVRMLQNPGLYGISETMLESDPTLKEHRKTLIHSAACILETSFIKFYCIKISLRNRP